MAALVVVLGMLDSFNATMDRNKTELLAKHPDRIAATLDGIVNEGGPELTALGAAHSVGAVEPVLRLGATLSTPGHQNIDVALEAIDLNSSLWAPTLQQGRLRADRAGLVLSRKAADDLGVTVGDTVTLKHPARQGDGFAVVETSMPVAAIHPGPFRFNAYIDRTQLDTLGLAGAANAAYLLPATGATSDNVERELFDLPGVTSVQPVAVATQVAEDSLQEFTGIFQVLELFILVLALLIAYNATSINADERRPRTGHPLRLWHAAADRALGLEMTEGAMIGLLGTAVGVGAGLLLNRWIITSTMSTTMPDMALDIVISASTVLTAIAFGMIAVAIAPLFTARRLRRMDIPGTLRVVE